MYPFGFEGSGQPNEPEDPNQKARLLEETSGAFNIAGGFMLVPSVAATGVALYIRLSTGEVPENLAQLGFRAGVLALVFGGLSYIAASRARAIRRENPTTD